MVRAVLAAALTALPLALAPPAAGHDAPSGWAYSNECCSSADCAPVDDEAIEEVQGGFRLTLRPGEHPMVKDRPVVVFVPHGDRRIQKSGDWRKHACLSRFGSVFCLYLVPGGT